MNPLTGPAAVAGLIGTPAFYFSGHVLVAFLLPLVLVGTLAWFVYASSLPDRGGRTWYAVCDRGLLVWSERLGVLATVPWESIAPLRTVGRDRDGLVRRLWSTNSAGPEAKPVADIRLVTAERDLIRAIAAAAPRPAPVARRVVAAAAGAGVLVPLLWVLVLPEFVTATVDELPSSVSGFGRACEKAGAKYTSARRLSASGSRTLVLFEVEDREAGRVPLGAGTTTAGPFTADRADEVQLVACSYKTGRGELIESCIYSGGITIDHYQGHYRVEVFEVRTHRRIGTVGADGSPNVTCSETTYGRENEDKEYDTSPDTETYREALRAFVEPEDKRPE
jgi:hypothetical protein